MDDKKICFITCVNDEEQYDLAMKYIHELKVPKGYKVQNICIKNAEYITKAYNEAMSKCDAKYKVYMHQDVYIINKLFIEEVINIFEKNEKIGLIGVVGAKDIPKRGNWWESKNTYGKMYFSHKGKMKLLAYNDMKNEYESVKAIDGLIMITQYDIPWREDILKGWHFYDISQSIEFLKAGYEVVVPRQNSVWCKHDCGRVDLDYYYRDSKKIFLHHYGEHVY